MKAGVKALRQREGISVDCTRTGQNGRNDISGERRNLVCRTPSSGEARMRFRRYGAESATPFDGAPTRPAVPPRTKALKNEAPKHQRPVYDSAMRRLATWCYLAAASSLSAKFGEPHPSLPPALMAPEGPTEFRSRPLEFWLFSVRTYRKNSGRMASPTRFERFRTMRDAALTAVAMKITA
jgi:hypothetical protein